MVRISLVPLKVCGFVWEAMWKSIDPANHIQKVNTQWSISSLLCVALVEKQVTIYYLHCPTAYCIWTILLRASNVSWGFLYKFADFVRQ